MPDQQDEVARMEDRAWASFALHAGQRLTTFNFFIILSSLLINGLVVTLQRDFRVPNIGVVIGLLLAVLAFIFWKIDVRNRQLIKLAEDVIKYFERTASKANDTDPCHVAALFTREAAATAKFRSAAPFWHFSYARAFAWVYCLVGTTGITCAVILLTSR
ncbi:MAG: hypothetical protein M3P06_02080 [Acidobacteriota bacterium]|nr:hypothetical protein [Acidobacteriota bacterium]